MSYKIIFKGRQGRELKLEIYNQEEYSNLSNYEKIQYNLSPEIDGWCELGAQEFIWGLIEANDPGHFGLPEILGRLMKENYPAIFNDWIENFQKIGEGEWSDRTDYLWSVLDEKEGENDEDELDPLDKSDIYFLDEAYKSDYIYELITQACKELAA